jgi:hypothetical protein
MSRWSPHASPVIRRKVLQGDRYLTHVRLASGVSVPGIPLDPIIQADRIVSQLSFIGFGAQESLEGKASWLIMSHASNFTAESQRTT